MIKAIAFDMDGVLFDTERISKSTWTQVGKEWNLPGVESLLNRAMGLNYEDTRTLFFEKYGKNFLYDDFRTRCSEIFDGELLKEGLPMKPGVLEILSYLKEAKVPVALSTSTRRVKTIAHLKEAGIEDYFEVVVTGDTVKHSKPDPEIYCNTCRALGTAPQETIAIEDSPNGLQSARCAGMFVVMIPDQVAPNKELEPFYDRVFKSLIDLKEWLCTDAFE